MSNDIDAIRAFVAPQNSDTQVMPTQAEQDQFRALMQGDVAPEQVVLNQLSTFAAERAESKQVLEEATKNPTNPAAAIRLLNESVQSQLSADVGAKFVGGLVNGINTLVKMQ